MHVIHSVHEAQSIPCDGCMGAWRHGDVGLYHELAMVCAVWWRWVREHEVVIVDEGANRMPRMTSRMLHVA